MRATDYTGIPHDFQPIDLNDPAVAPASDSAVRERHDREVREGRVESKGKFVHSADLHVTERAASGG
jgi:hypothetical protein